MTSSASLSWTIVCGLSFPVPANVLSVCTWPCTQATQENLSPVERMRVMFPRLVAGTYNPLPPTVRKPATASLPCCCRCHALKLLHAPSHCLSALCVGTRRPLALGCELCACGPMVFLQGVRCCDEGDVARPHTSAAPQVSHAAADLISRMLQPNPALRITIQGIMQHPWCVKGSA